MELVSVPWGVIGVVATVQTTEDEKPIKMKFSVVIGFRNEEITQCIRRHLLPGSKVVRDELACFNAVTDMGCGHEVHIVGSGLESVEHAAFHWVNNTLGYVKNTLPGTYHTIQAKHLPRHLAEFQYRFNRRYDLPSIIPRLLFAAVGPTLIQSHFTELQLRPD